MQAQLRLLHPPAPAAVQVPKRENLQPNTLHQTGEVMRPLEEGQPALHTTVQPVAPASFTGTPVQVRNVKHGKIRRMAREGYTKVAIAKAVSVSERAVYKVLRSKR